MNLLNASEFDQSGGYTIGIGAKNCLYTLRTEHWDTIGVLNGDGTKSSVPVRRSYHVRNLGKDWAEVAERLPDILREVSSMEDSSVYVPGHCEGRLDPNKPPDPKFIPTETIPFGDYQGSTISEVLEKKPDYLFWLAENYHASEERPRGRWLAFLRSELAPQLEQRASARRVEMERKQQEQAERKVRCAPLTQVLQGQSRHEGDFCFNMAKHFDAGLSVDELPDNAARIVREIWGKATGGRRGSKAYDGAVNAFDERFLDPEPVDVMPSATQVFEALRSDLQSEQPSQARGIE